MSTSRIITVYSTKGKRMSKVTTDVGTWGELQPLVRDEGYDLTSLHATESERRSDLNHKDAVLPETAFTLFLRPKKTKSGIDGAEHMGFKQLRAEVKNAMNNNKEHAKEHFSNFVNGKNYTQLSTDQLREAVAAYTPASSETSANLDNGVGEVVESVAQTSEEANPITVYETVRAAIETLADACDSTEDDDIVERFEDISDELDGILSDVKVWENPEAEAKRLAEIEEKNRLDEEADEIMRGFNN